MLPNNDVGFSRLDGTDKSSSVVMVRDDDGMFSQDEVFVYLSGLSS